MSGHEVTLAALWNIPVAQVVLITNGAFAPHSHEGNQAVGAQSAQPTAMALRHMVGNWPRALSLNPNPRTITSRQTHGIDLTFSIQICIMILYFNLYYGTSFHSSFGE